MKPYLKIALLVTTCVILLGQTVNAQSTNGNKNNPPGRENWFPNRGNVGIGTREPSTDLEVIGDVNVTNKLTSHEIETLGLRASTGSFLEDVSIGRNLYVDGKVGVGVPTPTHKFEIAGSLKVSESIYADYLEIREFLTEIGKVSGTLEVGQKLYVTGNTGLGVSLPSERLEVDGNAVITQTVRSTDGEVSNNQRVGNDLIVDNNIGVGLAAPSERVDVDGNIRASNDLLGSAVKVQSGAFSQDVIIQGNGFVNGNLGLGVASPTDRLEVAGNTRVSDELSANAIRAQMGEFEGLLKANDGFFVGGNAGFGVQNPGERLEVDGNIKSTMGLISKTVETDNLKVNEGIDVENLKATKVAAADLEVTNLINSNQISTAGNVGVGVAAPAEKLEVAGNAVVNGDVRSFKSVSGSSEVIQDLKVGGSAEISGGLSVQGPLTAPNFTMENFQVANLSISNVLDLAGGAQIQGDLNVAGVIKAGIIDAQEFRTEGVEAFSLTKVSMDELAVATTQGVPENYKLAVGGNILATGVDVKIPSKWPDYVFGKDYPRMSLTELEQFISKNGHLPNIPSAKEMEDRAVMDLATMNLKLLEKVEELSLYIIELEKRVNTLESATKK